jgi:phenylacetate-coenzyme A ligase PaaK-like adenylate-forming protein
MDRKNYQDQLFSIKNKNDFEHLVLEVFGYQSEFNKTYSDFLKGLHVDPEKVRNINDIPFLPVEFFRSHQIITGDKSFSVIFSSSGTSGELASKHFVKDVKLYEDVFTKIFKENYGDPSGIVILALLPSYLEREGSSLIYMMENLISKASEGSGFYLYEHEKLFSLLNELKKQNKKTMLFGVTFALIDFVNDYQIDFPELIVIETGGMKGKRKEMVREEVHEILYKGFNVNKIHSEYGMTELLSQAYSKGNGLFQTPPWMQIIIRDPYDPLQNLLNNSSGGINIIDLANIDSCSFIATQDLGKLHNDGSFEILGRFDFSDIRGCNLLY